jgi:hypothetical protein
VPDLVFCSYHLCLSFFGSVDLGSYRSYRTICVREISYHLDLYQESEVSVSVLKSVSFESDISLWSSSIELKF